MRKYPLGEFEEVVMLTVGVLTDKAYGFAIKQAIEGRLSRSVSVGALQSALIRLEDKGFLTSYESEGTQERAGRPKKYFRITMEGKKALEFVRATRNSLWNEIPATAFELSGAKKK